MNKKRTVRRNPEEQGARFFSNSLFARIEMRVHAEVLQSQFDAVHERLHFIHTTM